MSSLGVDFSDLEDLFSNKVIPAENTDKALSGSDKPKAQRVSQTLHDNELK
jgi:hypothetical protein